MLSHLTTALAQSALHIPGDKDGTPQRAINGKVYSRCLAVLYTFPQNRNKGSLLAAVPSLGTTFRYKFQWFERSKRSRYIPKIRTVRYFNVMFAYTIRILC